MSEQITIIIPSDSTPRPSILRMPSISHLTESSSSSCDSKPLNISFAPLPKIEGKKRRNRRPIGLAGRAELLQISRQRLAEAMANEDNYYGDEYSSYGEEEDIPLPDIGKLVKGLWRSISRIREKQSSTVTDQPIYESDSQGPGEPDLKSKSNSSHTLTSNPTPKPILHTEEKKPRGLTDTAEKSGPEISPHETRSTSPSSQVDEGLSSQLQISSISTRSQEDVDVKSLDDIIQVSVFNALKVETH
ncbi:hypothetical protein Clacol_006614 [Clathrus columnatus]|uniref:Uncharacterized protein n=1 Tax=Clathrus columnatus TaxID=1419009 RepID=A0AAV5AI56_9AGAM|nr:hypothetical protein Clacol_006614 [Clathrus columnatus]